MRGAEARHRHDGVGESVETVIGIKRDPVFGPVVMFGLGGVYVEVLKDVTLRLAPVDRATASKKSRTSRLLRM